jgi:hypothetical protein
VIVTEDFLGRDWPNREISAMQAIQARTGQNKIIPILDVPFALWEKRYPLLADLNALMWGEDKLELNAQQIAALLNRDNPSNALFTPSIIPDYIETDRLVLERFLVLLPSDGDTMGFLHEHDLADSFRKDLIDPLRTLVEKWNNAESSFLNANLAIGLSKFIGHVREFVLRLSGASAPVGDGTRLAVVPWKHREAFDMGNREEYQIVVSELNRAGSLLYEEHQELIQLARRQLLK